MQLIYWFLKESRSLNRNKRAFKRSRECLNPPQANMYLKLDFINHDTFMLPDLVNYNGVMIQYLYQCYKGSKI